MGFSWLLKAVVLTASIAISTGCAGLGSMGSAESPPPVMDQMRLEQIFSDQVEAITGPTGALQTKIEGTPVYCVSDPANDRMRIIAPIARTNELDPRIHEILLRANFHSTLDARYAISDGVVFSAFMHPISSLSPELIESAVSQVVSLVKTFGTSFSSGELIFPGPGSADSDSGGEDGQKRSL